MTQEEEELQHNILKLQDQAQQISLSQRATKNEFEAMMNVDMDGLEKKRGDMECLKNGLKS